MRANLFETSNLMPSSVSFYNSEFLKGCHPSKAYSENFNFARFPTCIGPSVTIHKWRRALGWGGLPRAWQTVLIGCVNAWQGGEGDQKPQKFAWRHKWMVPTEVTEDMNMYIFALMTLPHYQHGGKSILANLVGWLVRKGPLSTIGPRVDNFINLR